MSDRHALSYPKVPRSDSSGGLIYLQHMYILKYPEGEIQLAQTGFSPHLTLGHVVNIEWQLTFLYCALTAARRHCCLGMCSKNIPLYLSPLDANFGVKHGNVRHRDI